MEDRKAEERKVSAELCAVYNKGGNTSWQRLALHVLLREVEARIQGIETGYSIAKGYVNPKEAKDELITALEARRKELEK